MRSIKALMLCVVLSLTMLIVTGAATPQEMYENGVVSDGSVSFGDMRDGVVSDVSEGGEIMNGEGTGMMEDIMGGSDASGENSITAVPDMTNTPENSSAESTSGDTGTSGDRTEDEGGKTMGIIIAVAVAIAVIVIIFLLMPKRRG